MTASGSTSAGSSICNLALGRGSILVPPSVLLSDMGAVSSVVAEESKVFNFDGRIGEATCFFQAWTCGYVVEANAGLVKLASDSGWSSICFSYDELWL